MRRTLLNLAKNALEANCSKIVLSIEHNEDGIELLVKDDGEGIQTKKGIFEAFYTTKSKGSGLGLSIVNKIIYDHNGKINFEKQQSGAKINIKFQKNGN